MSAHLVIIESLASLAGGQRVLLNLMPVLAANFDVTVIVPESGPLTQALQAHPAVVITLPMGACYSIQRKTWRDVLIFATSAPRLTITLACLLRRTRAQIVLLNSAPSYPWGTLGSWLAGCPVVWFSHNVLVDAKSLALLRWLARLPNVRGLLASSAAAAAQYRVPAKTRIIPPGVDVTLYRPDPGARRQKRTELQLAPDAPVFAIIGDLIRLKGQHLVIEAVRCLLPRYPDLCLLIIGEARSEGDSQAYKAELQQVAQATPNIRFLGYRADVPALLAAVDGLIVASTTETGPLVLLEALACGVPVISTPVGRAPELLLPEAVFPIGNAAALADRLKYWLADSRRLRAASRAARALAEEQLTLECFRARMCTEIERNLG